MIYDYRKFIKYRGTHWATWMRKDGSIIRIIDMGYDHLSNSIQLMRRSGQSHLRTLGSLEKELAKRTKIC
jgi:hypothetical protein